MIYTVTFNPSIDYYLYLDQLDKNQINRVPSYEYVAGGKGINVSRMLANLDVANECVFFAGGFTGQFLVDEVSQNPLITVNAIPVDQPSRINVKIRHDGETDLNSKGAPLTDKNVKDLLETMKKVKEDDVVCICGSLQSKDLISSIVEISKNLKQAKAKLVLDVPNMTLQDIVECQPYLIKPNLEELQDLLKSEKPFPEILEEAKEQFIHKGVSGILLSLGKDGGCYISEKEVYKVNGPSLKPLNTVAAGDSMLAATIGMMSKNMSVKEAVQWGAACGSAAVLVPYIPTKQQVEDMLKQISIEVGNE